MIRRAGVAILGTLGLFLILLLALFAAIQTGPGKRLVEAAVGSLLAPADGEARLEGLGGFVPFDMSLDRLVLADGEGVWLEAERLRLAWSPGALLDGRLEVDQASVGRAAMARLPADDGPTEPEPIQLPELPSWLPLPVVERLAVERLVLAKAVLGEPAEFGLHGQLTPVAERALVLQLELERLDQATASASVTASLGLDQPILELGVTATESGGLLAALTGRPDAGDLDLRLGGRGTLDAWPGRLHVAATGLATLDARFDLALTEQPRVDLEATLAPSERLPESVRALLGDTATLALGVTRTGPQQVQVRNLRAETAAAVLTARATLRLDAETFEAEAGLDLLDLALLAPLVEPTLAGAGTLAASASGPLDAPEGRLHISGQDLVFRDLTIAGFDGTLDALSTAPLTGPDAAVRVTTEGKAIGLRLRELPLPDQDLTFEVEGEAPLSGPVVVERLDAATEQLRLNLAGRIDPATLDGEARATLAIDGMGALGAPFGQRIDGAAELEATLDVTGGAEIVTVDLNGSLERLAGLPPPLAALIGAAPRFEVGIAVSELEHVEISGLEVVGESAHLRGRGDFDLASERVGAAIRLELPELAVLSDTLGVELGGALDVAALLEGEVGTPRLDLTLEGEALTIEGQAVEQLTLEASSEGPPDAPAGSLRLIADTAGVELDLRTDYALRSDLLTLEQLQLEAPRSRARGRLEVDLAAPSVTGRLDGEVSDLVGLRPLLPLPLRGALRFDVELTADDEGRQSVALDLGGSNLRSELGRLARLDLDARLEDALGTPTVDASLTLADVRRDEIHLDRAALRASGGLAQLALQLSLDGEALYPLTLDAGGSLSIDDATTLRLERLDGSLDELPLGLEQPAVVHFQGDRLRLEGLALRLAEARATADLSLDPRRVEAAANVDPLPLGLLARFGGPAMGGALQARLTLAGAPDDPVGDLDLTVTDLVVADPMFGELPPVRIEARARLVDRRLRLDAEGTGVTDRPMTATLELPLSVSLNQGEIALPERGALAGSLDVELALTRVADLAGLHDDRLEGMLAVDLDLGGDLAAPRVLGSIEIVDALYENGATGMVLRDLTLRARADGSQLTIQELSATDGGDGRVDGSGVVRIDPAAGFPLDARLRMARARLVRLDELDATFSGDLSLSGDVADAGLSGAITVDRAEARIPDQIGPQIATLDVVEVGGATPQSSGANDATKPGRLDLDLAIDLPGRVFVRGRGLESEWKGRLRVTGPATGPRLTGYLEIHRGYFDLLDRRFDLRRGEIRFSGASPPSPYLDIQAAAQTGKVTALVNLEGELDDVEITFESEPSLPEDEILSHVMFDEQSSDLSAVQAIQLAAAVSRLRGGEGILDKVRSGLGVDTLDLVSDPETEETRARVGKYLSDEVYVEFEDGQADRSGRARVEVEILPGIAVEADTGEDQKSGIGLRWRYDY